MVCTTYLSDNEQNQPTGHPEIDQLIQLVRLETGENWQVIKRIHHFTSEWSWTYPFHHRVTHYRFDLYKEVGGCAPFQCITSGSGFEEHTLPYLYGILAGVQSQTKRP